MLFKTIAAYVRSSPILFSLIAAGGLFELLFHYLSALSYKYLIDKALIPKDVKVLAIIVGALLLIGLLNVMFGIASDYAKAKLGSRMIFDYRIKLFKHMQMQSHRFYEKFRLGDLLARYTEDIPAIQLAMIQTLSSGLVSLLSVIVGLAFLFWTEWRLTLIVIGSSILLFLPYRLLKAHSHRLNRDYLSELGQFTGVIDENIKSYKVIHGFDLRQIMLARVENNLRTMLSIGVRRNFVNSNINRLPLLVISILGALILGYGSYLTFDGSLSIGSFIAYNSIFLMVGQALFGLTTLIPAILASRISIQRFQSVLDWRPDVEEQGMLELQPVRRAISLQDVSFGYTPGELVLRDLNLAIPATGFTSIVGASGSGKSTVLQLLLRFEDPTSGAVLYDDKNIRHATYASLLRQVGIVFQDSILLRGTIRDNILVGKPDADTWEIEEAAKAAGIHDAIIGFQNGYDTMIHGQGDNLSGGERQRIALARALIRKPRILFLDEATSALDPEMERSVNETIMSLSRNRAVVSVTHRLVYAAMSDRIVVLDQGQVVESGNHDELMQRHGFYHRMWEKQQGIVLTKGGSVHVEWSRLGQIPFFRGLEPYALQEISRSFATQRFEAGVLVVEQGAEDDKFYIIVRGKAEVLVRAAETGTRRRVSVLEDGDYFGEMALMYSLPQAASIVTQSPCICLVLSGEDFHPLVTRFPSIREALEATLGYEIKGVQPNDNLVSSRQ